MEDTITAVGFFGILLGLAASLAAFLNPTRMRVVVFVLVYLLHIGASIFYYDLVKNGGGDAALYYYDPTDIYGEGFGFNTAFIVYVVQLPKSLFGGTYLDYFLLFQAVGFLGLVALMRTFEEIYAEAGVPQPIVTYALLFLPSLHYWTSAIGKDSLFFFAVCLALWASMRYKRRLVALALGLALMLAIRPHIAAIAVAAFAGTVIVDRQTRLSIKLPLFILALVGTAASVASVWNAFQVDLTNVDTYTDVLASREAIATSESAGNTAVTGSFPIRLLSLLFRPFFVDANGAIGLIVSTENALFALILGYLLLHFRSTVQMFRTVAFARYALVSSAVITVALAVGYYNVGLGIRQKATMVLPGILVAFVALQAIRGARARVVRIEEAPRQLHPSFG